MQTTIKATTVNALHNSNLPVHTVFRNDNIIFIAEVNTKLSKEEATKAILKAKTLVKNALLENHTERKFFHSKSGSKKIWAGGFWNMGHWTTTTLNCGIRVGLKDNECVTVWTENGGKVLGGLR